MHSERSDHSLKSLKVFLGFHHVGFAEMLVQVGDQAGNLITDEGKVEGFKLSEDLVAKNEVEAVDLGAAAADVCGNEILQLLHDTVTERQAEVLDDVVVKLGQLAKAFFGNLIFFFAFLKHGFEVHGASKNLPLVLMSIGIARS